MIPEKPKTNDILWKFWKTTTNMHGFHCFTIRMPSGNKPKGRIEHLIDCDRYAIPKACQVAEYYPDGIQIDDILFNIFNRLSSTNYIPIIPIISTIKLPARTQTGARSPEGYILFRPSWGTKLSLHWSEMFISFKSWKLMFENLPELLFFMIWVTWRSWSNGGGSGSERASNVTATQWAKQQHPKQVRKPQPYCNIAAAKVTRAAAKVWQRSSRNSRKCNRNPIAM